MNIFTNKNMIQKIIIALVLIMVFSFSIPKPVQADLGGKLMNPVVNFLTAILDGFQHMLEWAMLGETSDYMKPVDSKSINRDNLPEKVVQVEQKLDGTFFGLKSISIPVITYTPEAIFSNQVPALDVNFISPSVMKSQEGTEEADKKVQERNIANQLRPTIASWYSAIRMVAIVALMSVLLYLGIRMLLTSIAADRAKYKKMLMDWVMAICLLFAMHYIMSFALTMTETVTSMLANDKNATFTVELTQNPSVSNFGTNLMSYVRLMIQSANLSDKLAFFFLYLMLVIYNFRFTWVYLKRVVNMAFLTLMAPLVAVTYPIDKVGDSKAQAFDMWLKEFTFSALIQPLHLLIYVVLLGSAAELAVYNPLYAIVCLGFIIAAEKLLKKMFGFDKAPGGTIGSLAGAAGVTVLAGKGVEMITKGARGKGGSGNGKVRTDDRLERKGKDKGANKDLDSFNKQGALGFSDQGEPVKPLGESLENVAEGATDALTDTATDTAKGQKTLDQLEQERAQLYDQEYTDNSKEGSALNQKIQNGEFIEKPEPNIAGSPIPEESRQVLEKTKEEQQKEQRQEKRRRIIGGVKAAAKTAMYSAARGTMKALPSVTLGLGLGAMTGVIGSTLDAEKAMAMAISGFAGGARLGGNIFESTVGKAIPEKNSLREYDRERYGSVKGAQNARADKAYFRNGSFDDFYDENFKDKKKKDGSVYTKEEIAEATSSWRKSGITDEKTIKRGILLEDQYRNDKAYKTLSNKEIRENVQNIAQTRGAIETKAFYDPEAKEKELKRIEESLTNVPEQHRKAVANRVFKGYEDFRSIT